jgi:hypothetical protein
LPSLLQTLERFILIAVIFVAVGCLKGNQILAVEFLQLSSDLLLAPLV